MDNNEIVIINDIIRINNERSQGYKSAVGELNPEDEDLKTIFTGMAQQSANYKSVMEELQLLSEDSENQPHVPGEVYHTWGSIKVDFFGPDRQTILNSCEKGEDAIMKAYQSALNTEGLSLTTKSILESQQTELRAAHIHIKELRDSIA